MKTLEQLAKEWLKKHEICGNQAWWDGETYYITVKDREYQIKECAEGLQIIEITDKEIFIRPHYANSIIITEK